MNLRPAQEASKSFCEWATQWPRVALSLSLSTLLPCLSSTSQQHYWKKFVFMHRYSLDFTNFVRFMSAISTIVMSLTLTVGNYFCGQYYFKSFKNTYGSVFVRSLWIWRCDLSEILSYNLLYFPGKLMCSYSICKYELKDVSGYLSPNVRGFRSKKSACSDIITEGTEVRK